MLSRQQDQLRHLELNLPNSSSPNSQFQNLTSNPSNKTLQNSLPTQTHQHQPEFLSLFNASVAAQSKSSYEDRNNNNIENINPRANVMPLSIQQPMNYSNK